MLQLIALIQFLFIGLTISQSIYLTSITPRLNDRSTSQTTIRSFPSALQSSSVSWFDANFTLAVTNQSIGKSSDQTTYEFISWADSRRSLVFTSFHQLNDSSINSSVIDYANNQLTFQSSAPITTSVHIDQSINPSTNQTIGITFLSSTSCAWPACSLITFGPNPIVYEAVNVSLPHTQTDDQLNNNQTLHQTITKAQSAPGTIHVGLINSSSTTFSLQITIITSQGTVTILSSISQLIGQWNFVLIQFPLFIKNGSLIDIESINGQELLTVQLNENDTVPPMTDQSIDESNKQTINFTVGDPFFDGSVRDIFLTTDPWNQTISFELIDWMVDRWSFRSPPARMIAPVVSSMTFNALNLDWTRPRSTSPIQYYMLKVLSNQATNQPNQQVNSQVNWYPLFSPARQHQFTLRPDMRYSFGIQAASSEGVSISAPIMSSFYTWTQSNNQSTNATIYVAPPAPAIYVIQSLPEGVQLGLTLDNSTNSAPVDSIAIFYSLDAGLNFTLLCTDCELGRGNSVDILNSSLVRVANIMLPIARPGNYVFKAQAINIAGGANSTLSGSHPWQLYQPTAGPQPSSESSSSRSSTGMSSSASDQISTFIPLPPALSTVAGTGLSSSRFSSSSSLTGAMNSSSSVSFNQSSSSSGITGRNATTNSSSSTSTIRSPDSSSSSLLTSSMSSVMSTSSFIDRPNTEASTGSSSSAAVIGNNDSVLIGLVIGLSVGAIVLATLVYCCFCRKTTPPPAQPARPEDLELGSLDEEWDQETSQKAAGHV